jgi:hypothetical protein
MRCTFIAASEVAPARESSQGGEFFDKMMIRIESFAARATSFLACWFSELVSKKDLTF